MKKFYSLRVVTEKVIRYATELEKEIPFLKALISKKMANISTVSKSFQQVLQRKRQFDVKITCKSTPFLKENNHLTWEVESERVLPSTHSLLECSQQSGLSTQPEQGNSSQFSHRGDRNQTTSVITTAFQVVLWQESGAKAWNEIQAFWYWTWVT